jgi:hypothetical protein
MPDGASSPSTLTVGQRLAAQKELDGLAHSRSQGGSYPSSDGSMLTVIPEPNGQYLFAVGPGTGSSGMAVLDAGKALFSIEVDRARAIDLIAGVMDPAKRDATINRVVQDAPTNRGHGFEPRPDNDSSSGTQNNSPSEQHGYGYVAESPKNAQRRIDSNNALPWSDLKVNGQSNPVSWAGSVEVDQITVNGARKDQNVLLDIRAKDPSNGNTFIADAAAPGGQSNVKIMTPDGRLFERQNDTVRQVVERDGKMDTIGAHDAGVPALGDFRKGADMLKGVMASDTYQKQTASFEDRATHEVVTGVKNSQFDIVADKADIKGKSTPAQDAAATSQSTMQNSNGMRPKLFNPKM